MWRQCRTPNAECQMKEISGMRLGNFPFGIRHLAFGIAAVLFCLSAWGGTIRTLDGNLLTGTIAFGSHDDLVINNAAGLDAHVDLHDLLDASLGEHVGTGILPAGLLLTNGDAIAATVNHADDATLTYTRSGGTGNSHIDISKVADITFHPLTAAMRAKVAGDATGALLATGDFIEGDLAAVADGKVRISSVLLGNVDMPMDWRLLLVRLRPAQTVSSNWVVRLLDGSILHGNKIAIANSKLTVTGADGVVTTLLAGEVGQIEVGPAHMTALNDDRPALEPNDPARLYTNSAPGGLPAQLLGASVQHGLCLAANTTVSFDLDAHARTLVARVGVPQGILPTAKVRFTVLLDGKVAPQMPTVYRTSIDDSIMLAVKVAGAKKLSLRVESPSEGQTGAWGLWGDVAIIRD